MHMKNIILKTLLEREIMQFKSKGFTLLEVMVSLALLATAITTLVVVRNNSIQQASEAKENRRITILLGQKMGELVSGIETKTHGEFQENGYENYNSSWTITEVPVESHVDPNTSEETQQKVFSVTMKKIVLTIKHKRNEEISSTIEAHVLKENPEDAEEKEKPKPESDE